MWAAGGLGLRLGKHISPLRGNAQAARGAASPPTSGTAAADDSNQVTNVAFRRFFLRSSGHRAGDGGARGGAPLHGADEPRSGEEGTM